MGREGQMFSDDRSEGALSPYSALMVMGFEFRRGDSVSVVNPDGPGMLDATFLGPADAIRDSVLRVLGQDKSWVRYEEGDRAGQKAMIGNDEIAPR